MFGFVEWTQESKSRRGAWTGERFIGGVRFLTLTLYREEKYRPLSQRRRCAAGAKLLRKAGVTRAVFPKDFPWLEVFEKQGVTPVADLPLRRELAASFAAFLLAERGVAPANANVAVAADRLSGEVMRAVTDLCRRNRYVMLDLPQGSGEFCRELRRSYGVSVLQDPTAEQLGRADVLLLFAPRTGAQTPGQAALPLYEGAERAFGWSAAAPGEALPAGCETTQLLAALREAGALRPECLEIRGVQFQA